MKPDASPGAATTAQEAKPAEHGAAEAADPAQPVIL